MKMTHTYALSVAIRNLSTSGLYDPQGVNILSEEDCAAVIADLEKMFDTTVKRAESAKNREHKPTPKEIAAKEETAKIAEQTFTVMSERPDFLFECKMLAETVGVSTPKMARILASLVEVGKVERIEGKKPNFKMKGE